MASSKGLGADPAYLRLINLARATEDEDLVKAMEHLSHNSRLDRPFLIYDRTSQVGKAAFEGLGLPREGITVHQAVARAHAYAVARDGHGYAEFADAVADYLGLAVGEEGEWAGNVGGVAYRPQERQASPHDEALVFSRDPDLIDRGTVAHMDIQDSLADVVSSHGLAPLSPLGDDPQFDLAWRDGPAVVVCEVKSLTAENEISQLRLGLGQVLSYLYKLNWRDVHEVRGVLAVEREPTDSDWIDICADHGVTLTWAPDFPRLFAEE